VAGSSRFAFPHSSHWRQSLGYISIKAAISILDSYTFICANTVCHSDSSSILYSHTSSKVWDTFLQLHSVSFQKFHEKSAVSLFVVNALKSIVDQAVILFELVSILSESSASEDPITIIDTALETFPQVSSILSLTSQIQSFVNR
jgi:hypothetical protein